MHISSAHIIISIHWKLGPNTALIVSDCNFVDDPIYITALIRDNVNFFIFLSTAAAVTVRTAITRLRKTASLKVAE